MKKSLLRIILFLCITIFSVCTIFNFCTDERENNLRELAVLAAHKASYENINIQNFPPDKSSFHIKRNSDYADYLINLHKVGKSGDFTLILDGTLTDKYNFDVIRQEIKLQQISLDNFKNIEMKIRILKNPTLRGVASILCLRKFHKILPKTAIDNISEDASFLISKQHSIKYDQLVLDAISSLIEIDVSTGLLKLLSIVQRSDRLLIYLSNGIGKPNILKLYKKIVYDPILKEKFNFIRYTLSCILMVDSMKDKDINYINNKLRYAGLIHNIDRNLQPYNMPMMYYWMKKIGREDLANTYKHSSISDDVLYKIQFKYRKYITYATRIFAIEGDFETSLLLLKKLNANDRNIALRHIYKDAKDPIKFMHCAKTLD